MKIIDNLIENIFSEHFSEYLVVEDGLVQQILYLISFGLM